MMCARFATLALRCRFLTRLAVGTVIVLLAGAANGEGAKTPRTDLYGDPLPPGAVARLGTIRLRHPNADVTFSKDGKRLISCDLRGEIRVWDVATGKRLREKRLSWPRDARPFNRRALSPDGAVVAMWDEETVYLWDTNTGKERGRIPSILGHFLAPNFSSDGMFLAVQALDDGLFTAQIWDVAAVKKRQTLKGPSDGYISSIALTGDNKRLVGIIVREFDAMGKICPLHLDLSLWDVATGQLLRQRKNLRQIVDSLAFSPDGKTLAVGGRDEEGVRLLDAATLKQKALLKLTAKVHADFHYPIFSPDGRWLAASYEYPVFLKPRLEPGVFLWDLTWAKEARRLPLRYRTRLAFAPDGKTLACYDESTRAEIRLYDVASGRPLHQRPGHACSVQALAVSPDGKVVASSSRDLDPMLRLWDTATGKQLRVLEAPHHRFEIITSCLFSPDGKWVISVGNTCSFTLPRERVQLWDVAAGKFVRRFEINEGHFDTHAAGITADSRWLAAVVSMGAGLGGQLIVWDLATGRLLSQRPYKFEVRVPAKSERNSSPRTEVHAAFAPDGASVTVWLGDRVGIEEVSTGCLLSTLPKGVGRPLVFAPDGRLLAAAIWQPRKEIPLYDDLKGLSLIETASGEEVVRLEVKSFNDIAFTRDGHGLIVADNENLCVWDTSTGEKLHQMAWPEGIGGFSAEVPLAALPGGRVATGMTEGDILVWDLAPSTWPVRKSVRELGREKLDALWSNLLGDARKAHRAIYKLADVPTQALTYLKGHLRPVAVDTKRVEKLLADLDGDSFEAREAASRELARMHYRAEPMLRRALEGKPSLEMRRRLEAILAGPKRPSAEDLRTLRAIAVMERIGTPEARRILEKFASGAAARETREAKAALERLKRR